MPHHALAPDDDRRPPDLTDNGRVNSYPPLPSPADSQADIEDWAVADFLSGDYVPSPRRYTTADWFGDE